MAILKKYDSTQKKKTLEGKIPSGWESGDSKAEMLVVEPLIQHPEIPGLYRAVDPTTGWKGWVEYTPPAVQPPAPDPLLETKRNFEILTNKISEAKRLVDLGVLTETEAGLANLQAQAKLLWQDLNK